MYYVFPLDSDFFTPHFGHDASGNCPTFVA